MRPTAMRVSRARVPLERSDANVVRDYTAYVVLVLVVVVHVVVVRSSAAQRASVGKFEPPFGAPGFVIGRFVLILLSEEKRESCFCGENATRRRRRRNDDGRRQTWIRSVDECEVRVKSYLARVGIRVLFSSS